MYVFVKAIKLYKNNFLLRRGDADAIKRIAYEFCEDAVKEGVLYCEVRYCPHLLTKAYGSKDASSSPLTPRDVVMCVNKGLSKGAAHFNLTVRSILCCFRANPGRLGYNPVWS